MPSAGQTHANVSKRAVVAALCLALSATPLTACSGQKASDVTDEGASASTEQAAIDPSSWKTLGDALATQTEPMSSAWDDDYYVAMFRAGDSVIRVVAKIDKEVSDKIDEVDWMEEDVVQKLIEVAGTCELVTAEDLTDKILSQDELDQLVGKTGQDLVDDGWTFAYYYMYGWDETAAAFEKDDLAYAVTFNVTLADDATEDGGASIMGEPIVSTEFLGAADSATDPAQVE